MKIGLDAMGGDYAPEQVVKGAVESVQFLNSDERIVLLGDKDKIVNLIKQYQSDLSLFDIVHTSQVIDMHDNPAKAFQQKPDSSIAVGFKMLASGQIDGFASAGSTGAMLVGTMYTIKTIPGIIRPGISSVLPQINGNKCIILDVGINPDCRPDVLYQYAQLGKAYCQYVFGISNPKVALLNIGSEESKGNLVVKATYELMKSTIDFDFAGNIEGYDLFRLQDINVVVCDGFVGNVVLKQAEGFYHLFNQHLPKNSFLEKFNFENYGGTPILGVNKTVMIGHGVSNSRAIQSMILQTRNVIKAKLTEKITEIFK